jgi:hypothetical protein
LRSTDSLVGCMTSLPPKQIEMVQGCTEEGVEAAERVARRCFNIQNWHN